MSSALVRNTYLVLVSLDRRTSICPFERDALPVALHNNLQEIAV
jgi:hypothetical protein